MRRVVAAALMLAACKGATSSPASDPVAAVPAGSATAAASVAPKTHEHDSLRPHHEEPVVECAAHVAETADDETRVQALLDQANRDIEHANYGAAWTCADRAADIAPASVEAHHLRGASLAALHRDDEAQMAYSLALALDPDDPETLRAVADFYVNGKSERGRDSLRLGLELAQRGSRRALARRRRNAPLAADLAVLEAQALNDLGRSDEALDRVDTALRVAPDRGDALHERGVALFDLSRFADARVAFQKALVTQPQDAYTHQMLGLSLEQVGEVAQADIELAKAIELAPHELSVPVLIPVDEFQKEVDDVIAKLPNERKAHVKSIKVEVVDLPDPIDLKAVQPPFPPTILGLYRGPVGRVHQPGDEPPSIVLYRKNLARAVKTRGELSEQIRDTLLHEIGHLEGLDEDDLRRRGME
jgi:Flp pilus assembly protein TadD/predicted Zn-dependent protease with MMP-like domain